MDAAYEQRPRWIRRSRAGRSPPPLRTSATCFPIPSGWPPACTTTWDYGVPQPDRNLRRDAPTEASLGGDAEPPADAAEAPIFVGSPDAAAEVEMPADQPVSVAPGGGGGGARRTWTEVRRWGVRRCRARPESKGDSKSHTLAQRGAKTYCFSRANGFTYMQYAGVFANFQL